METRKLSPEAIRQQINATKRYGLQAHHLTQHGRTLVDLLIPPGKDNSDESLSVRASAAEDIIRQAIDRLGGDVHPGAYKVLLGLSYDGNLPPLNQRRAEAAKILGISPITFSGGKREKDLIGLLANKLYNMISCLDPLHAYKEMAPRPSPRGATGDRRGATHRQRT